MHLSPSLLPAPPGRRAGMAPRLLAATLGGYVLCFALAGALHALMPAGPLPTLLPFLVCAATVFWAFAARDAWQLWTMLLVPALLCAGVVLLLPA